MNENISTSHLKDSQSVPEAFNRLYTILRILRGPNGCPWDQKQTPESFYKNLIEESYEYIDAFKKRDTAECAEELGDMFLVVSMLVIMHEEQDEMRMVDVLEETSRKLIRRHPHVFAQHELDDDSQPGNADEVVELWDSIKENLEGKHQQDNIFAFIPKSMPNILQSIEIQKKARKTGFDWEQAGDVLEKIYEELHELQAELDKRTAAEVSREKVLDEFGDVLFSLINYSRFLAINPDEALYLANEKFKQRFTVMQELMKKDGLDTDNELTVMDSYWNKAKKQLDT